MYSERLEFGSISSSNSPHFINGVEFQGFNSLFIGVNQTAVSVSRILLCKVACHLCKGLVWSQTDGDGDSDRFLDSVVKVLTPLFEVDVFHTIQIDEALIYAV